MRWQNLLYHKGTDDKEIYANTVPQMRSKNYKGNVAHLNSSCPNPEDQNITLNN